MPLDIKLLRLKPKSKRPNFLLGNELQLWLKRNKSRKKTETRLIELWNCKNPNNNIMEKKEKKYRPIYMPLDEDNEDDEPIFNTEDEAWDYIHKTKCQCQFKDKNKDYCYLCAAEWDVETLTNPLK